MWVLAVLLFAAIAIGVVDRVHMEKRLLDAMSAHSLEKDTLKMVHKQEISKLLEENSRLQSERAVCRRIEVQSEKKRIERICAKVEIPREMTIEEFNNEYGNFVRDQVWDMIKNRAIIEVQPNYYRGSTDATYSWFINVDGELRTRDSFFEKS